MESPFQDIIHTNALPTEEQSGRIHDLVSSSQKQAQGLTAEINRLESLLDELLEKRNQLTDFIDAHLALVSPARRTPDDVVREIFIAALPSDFPATLSGTAAPLLLCHISQKWRALALSTPRLWTSLHVIPPPVNPLNGSSESKSRHLAEAVRTWLSRSGSLPLTISFVARMSAPPFTWSLADDSGPNSALVQANISSHETVLHSLLEFSSRWESFRFRVPDYVDLGSIVDVLPAQLPILRSASIDSPATEDQFAFLNTNTLTALSFRITAEIPMSSISWSTIRHLSLYQDRYGLGESAPRHVLAILRQCSQLETCSLSVHWGEVEDTGEPMLLDKLRYLEIEDFTHSGDISPVFRTLITPNLCLLRYMDESGPPKHSLPILPIVASSSMLTSLVLDVCSAVTPALHETLQAAGGLEELTLQWEPLPSAQTDNQTDHILVLLTPSRTEPGTILCPRLQKLALLNFSALSDDTLLQFILARTEPQIVHSPMACLERVRAYFRRTQQIDLTALPSIQERVAAGLELRLEYLPPPFVSYKVWEGNQGYRQWDPACKVWGAALESEESWTRRR